MWDARKKLKQSKEICVNEWSEYVANAARIGHNDDDEYDWSSYDTILRDLKAAWKSKRSRRQVKAPRRTMTSAHRIKIANAIKEKWGELSYRSLVEASIQARREKRGTGRVQVQNRFRKNKHQLKDKKLNETVVMRSDNEVADDYDLVPDAYIFEPETLQSTQKVLPAYKNPLTSEMLAKLKQIRARRRSNEMSRSNVLEKARILMAEARMATKALEAQAVTNESAVPPLLEAQQLLAEAAESFKAAGLGADFFLETFKD